MNRRPPGSTLFLYTTLFRSSAAFALRTTAVALVCASCGFSFGLRSEEHTSELQSQSNLVCRLLLEKKNIRPALQESPCDAASLGHGRSQSTLLQPPQSQRTG